MDLVDLFVGSEGTLGVIVDATLRVQPVRPATCLAFTTVRDRPRAIALVGALRDAAIAAWRSGDHRGLDISAIEHMDARSLALLRHAGADRRAGMTLDTEAALGLLLVIELPPGTNTEQVYGAFGDHTNDGPAAAVGRLYALLEAHDAVDQTVIAPPDDAAAAGRLLGLREAVPTLVNQRVAVAQRTIDPRIQKTAADVVVPFERFGEMLELFDRELTRRGLDAAIWGHISDGNVHPNVMPRSVAELESGREALLLFGREAIRMGGAPLAEHGVGRNAVKQQLLRELYGDAGIAAMCAVKRALDPEWKLAPGVIVPERAR